MNQWEELLRNTYAGILANYPDIRAGREAHLRYDRHAKEFRALKEAYHLEEIAKDGGAVERAKRLLHYFAPRLSHDSWYDNHVACNARELLAFSFENKEHGINCLNKAKILAECCLALGIYARRVFIQPFSPYDFDSHVVTEIYDVALGKWVMLDPSTDGYFVDDRRVPLSMLEIRERFAASEFLTFVSATDRLKDLEKSAQKNASINTYFLKNCFLISFERYNGFGEKDGTVRLLPAHYSVLRNQERNIAFRRAHIPPEQHHLLEAQENWIRKIALTGGPAAYSAASVYRPPMP